MTPADLQKFCSDEDTRYYLRAPFSRGDFTYATDGYIGVRVPRIADVTNEEGPDFEKLMSSTAPAVNTQPFPAVVVPPRGPKPLRPCKDCDGLGYIKQCSHCQGQGETDCYACGHECGCEHCDGSGVLDVMVIDGKPSIAKDHADAIPCEDCDGEGVIVDDYKLLPIEIAPGLFFSDEVIPKLQTLPGLKLDLRPFDGAPHRFEFDGGDGLAMPMRMPKRDDKHAVRLPADTKENAEAVA